MAGKDGRISLFYAALRIETTKTEYQTALAEAERIIPEAFKSKLLRAKVAQLLGGEISKIDKLNLAVVEVFSEADEISLLRLLVRHLSPDVPSVALNADERQTLASALKQKGIDIAQIAKKAEVTGVLADLEI